MRRRIVVGVILCCVAGIFAAAPQERSEIRQRARKLQGQGNHQEAYELYEKLLNDPQANGDLLRQDLSQAYDCLRRLNRVKDIDTLLENAVTVHQEKWQVLHQAAQLYMNNSWHYGYMVAGEFRRGRKRGGQGKVVNSYERDRVRALQLMDQALPLLKQEERMNAKADFYRSFAQMMLGNRGYNQAWRLQYKTDLDELPDYEEGWGYHHRDYGRRSQHFAPVDIDGNPIFYEVPKSFGQAESDGERWRYLLMMRMELNNAHRKQCLREYADFLHAQFGVHTMASYSWYGRGGNDDEESDRQSGILSLHKLDANETIARLATGIKRFQLPDEHNYILIYRQLGEDNHHGLQQRAKIWVDRRQYDKAVPIYEKIIAQFPNSSYATNAQQQLNQILKPWGQFEPGEPQPAGTGAKLQFRFRNGRKVVFTAHAVKVEKLLEDVKAYLKSNPKRLEHQKVNIGNIGHRLVRENQRQYVGEQVAEWSLDLNPRELHFDKRITVSTPLQKAGAYLVEAKMADGNVTRIIAWLADTTIVRKPVEDQSWYYIADAVSGEPVPGARVEFFGYRQEYVGKIRRKVTGRRYVVHTKSFTKKSDANGQVLFSPNEAKLDNHNLSYVAIARHQGRLAYFGFQGIWHSNYNIQNYNQRKTYTITDRPVYRPGQTVKFKVWTSQVRYDVDDTSQYAGRTFSVRIRNPRNERVFEKNLTADQYGGFNGEFELPADAKLGNYYLWIHNWGGGLQFRVEEYKKPEFEVSVEAPDKPVMLGETVPVTVKAKYYFGAPVVNAKVKVKVLRNDYSASWYPSGQWDWFYGPGYWWFAADYPWYPGWQGWGCRAPFPWWHRSPSTPPEVVLQQERLIQPDGTIKLEIDTRIARELHGDTDHRYKITAEVTDESRRTIVGSGQVLVARAPFKVYTWVDRGHYNVGDTINANFLAQTLDNKPVQGKGEAKLYRISYTEDGKPVEKAVKTADINTNDEGRAEWTLTAADPGQYRISYTVTDDAGHSIEGGYIFVIRGKDFNSGEFRFSKLELIPDRKEYAPGDTVNLLINADRRNATVLLFLRPVNGAYRLPKFITLDGKSDMTKIDVTKADMPNFFVEAVTVYDGKLHTVTKEIVVPPEKRVLNVTVTPSQDEYKPGEKAAVQIQLTDHTGEPFAGSVAMSIYDKAVEYISGGSNVPEMKSFFWKWRRRHNPRTASSLQRHFGNLLQKGQIGMKSLGAFGRSVADSFDGKKKLAMSVGGGGARTRQGSLAMKMAASPAPASARMDMAGSAAVEEKEESAGGQPEEQMAEATVRTNFADTAYWNGNITTGRDGKAEIELTMPENLSGWKIRTWALGKGPRVGEGTVEVVTTKNLLLRMQTPRFFVEKDEVVLSANIHNYLDTAKRVRAVLELDGGTLHPMTDLIQEIEIPAQGEKRADWRIKVMKEGTAVVRMKALTDEESDAMEMSFPVKVHGMMKTESFSGHLRHDAARAMVTFAVPEDRREAQSLIEVRYSPTLAGAMIDALPYLASYPYGCTEQTLNRFLPTVITQKILIDMGLDLNDIREKRINLNAQEIGDDKERAAQWARGNYTQLDAEGNPIWTDNPVYSRELVADMVETGIIRLGNMQLSDGGWGWFSGWGEKSYPHTTATVVHGLQLARANDAMVPDQMLNRGIAWLTNYQDRQVRMLKNASDRTKPWKSKADNLDALVFMVLTDADVKNKAMQEYLYRDRNNLSVYGKCTIALAFHKLGLAEETAMLKRNIEQFLVTDPENQTAYLRLGNEGYWWYWYGSEYEAHAYYLKLLAAVEPKGQTAPWLVKYLLNNRKHATYWKSTRDTALCVEAFADFMRGSEEDQPDMVLEVYLDGKKQKEVKITKDNIFSFDNKLLVAGKDVTTGKHTLEFRRQGKGPLYFNTYVSYFSLEDFITRAGLEVKVNRRYFKLIPVDKTIKVAGSRGQALDQKVEKFEREELSNLDTVKSGDLVEIELIIESKNDYEYLIFEDMKAAGFEPFKVRSGYVNNGLNAYMELRDDRVSFFVRHLPRGKHSMSYRMRAEIPGRFSALPAKAYAMYAPELRGNSDEIKIKIEDVGLMREE